jgi:hypothetical protein
MIIVTERVAAGQPASAQGEAAALLQQLASDLFDLHRSFD